MRDKDPFDKWDLVAQIKCWLGWGFLKLEMFKQDLQDEKVLVGKICTKWVQKEGFSVTDAPTLVGQL